MSHDLLLSTITLPALQIIRNSLLLISILMGSGRRRAPIPESLFGRHLPVPACKVDQVPRTCTARLRKKTTARDYNKDGVERFRHVSTKGRSLTPTLFSILYLYRRGEKDKTVDIFSWLTYTSYSHKKS